MSTVVIYGNSDTTTATIVALMKLNLSMTIAVAGNSNDDHFNRLASLAGLGYNHLQKATPKVIATADLLVFTDTTVTADNRDESDAQFNTNFAVVRAALNVAMANGFDGAIMVATTHDELLTYFARRFSGIPADRVLGLGTAPHSLYTANRIAQALAVPVRTVAVDVVGTATDFQVLWSRAAVSTVPLLSMVQNTTTAVDANLIQNLDRDLVTFAKSAGATVTADVVSRLAAVLLSDGTDIVPIMLVVDDDDQHVVSARPAVIGRGHVKVLPRVAGAQTEEQAWAKINGRVQAAITQIEQDRSN